MKMLLLTCLAIVFLSTLRAPAQEGKSVAVADRPKEASVNASQTGKSLPDDPEERFKTLLTNASLSGRWAPLDDGMLGEERGGDSYRIASVSKGDGDNWIVRAKMKYRNREFVLPIPVQVRFVGDTAILIVDKLAIPGGNTYSARLMFYERTYSGTWTSGRGGGMLYGTIMNETE